MGPGAGIPDVCDLRASSSRKATTVPKTAFSRGSRASPVPRSLADYLNASALTISRPSPHRRLSDTRSIIVAQIDEESRVACQAHLRRRLRLSTTIRLESLSGPSITTIRWFASKVARGIGDFSKGHKC